MEPVNSAFREQLTGRDSSCKAQSCVLRDHAYRPALRDHRHWVLHAAPAGRM